MPAVVAGGADVALAAVRLGDHYSRMGSPDLIVAAFELWTTKFWVTVGGGVCELLGLTLVVLDVRAARRSAMDISPGGDLFVDPFVDERTHQVRDLEGLAPDERMDALTKVIDALAMDIREQKDATEAMRAEMQTKLRKNRDREKARDARDRALRAVLASWMEGSVLRSLTGSALFGVGVVASAISNLM